MGFRTCVQLVEFAVYGTVASSSGIFRPVRNVFHFERTGTAAYVPASKAAWKAAFATNVWNPFSPVLSDTYNADGCYVWLMQFPGDVPQDQGLLTNGGNPSDRLPLSQAAFCYLGSGLRGRFLSGSKRLSPISQSDVAGDEFTPTALASWNAAVAGFKATWSIGPVLNRSTFHPVIWSRTKAVANPLPNPQVCVDIVSAQVYSTLSSWRHRRERTIT